MQFPTFPNTKEEQLTKLREFSELLLVNAQLHPYNRKSHIKVTALGKGKRGQARQSYLLITQRNAKTELN